MVDDEPAARLTLSDTLEAMGFATESADTGEAAVGVLAAASQRAHFNLVITDQRMDNGDGWFVLDTIRAEYPELPVILLSGEAPDPHRDAPTTLNKSLCFDAVLRKPVADAVLADTIRQVIHDHRQQQYQQLLNWIEEGEITEIEQWCQRPNSFAPAWENKVLAAAHRLDFCAIQTLIEHEKMSFTPQALDSRNA